MRATSLCTVLFAGLLLAATATVAHAQATDQEHDAHHPGETQTAPEVQAPGAGESPTAGMGQGGSGMMGMMSPDMMRMMRSMMMQQGNAGQPGAMMPGAMMGDATMCPTMPMMAGMGPASSMSMAGNHGLLYGMPKAGKEMTPQRVRAFLETHLAWHGNPRLKLGEIATAEDGSITAEIITVDGSLVQKLAFNRYPGLFRQVQ